MAKAIKAKKEKTPTVTETLIKGSSELLEQMDKRDNEVIKPYLEESIIETPEIGDEPPSVTLEEVKEVEKVEENTEPLVVKSVIPEPREVVMEVSADLIKSIGSIPPSPVTFVDNSNLELPMEQKIENFLEGKDGYVKANDFLKSLFGIPKFNEPPKWLIQGNSKLLKATLEKMVANSDIVVRDNQHRLLGQSYYPDSTTGKQQHRNLNNVEIYIKK